MGMQIRGMLIGSGATVAVAAGVFFAVAAANASDDPPVAPPTLVATIQATPEPTIEPVVMPTPIPTPEVTVAPAPEPEPVVVETPAPEPTGGAGGFVPGSGGQGESPQPAPDVINGPQFDAGPPPAPIEGGFADQGGATQP